jgi:hypothetical protein
VWGLELAWALVLTQGPLDPLIRCSHRQAKLPVRPAILLSNYLMNALLLPFAESLLPHGGLQTSYDYSDECN